jgi:hypothetical protein
LTIPLPLGILPKKSLDIDSPLPLGIFPKNHGSALALGIFPKNHGSACARNFAQKSLDLDSPLAFRIFQIFCRSEFCPKIMDQLALGIFLIEIPEHPRAHGA